MINAEEAQAAVAAPMKGSGGEKLGTVQEVLVNSATGDPEWMIIAVGAHAEERHFLPTQHVTLSGKDLSVPYTYDSFNNAPPVDREHTQPSPSEASALYRHFGIDHP